MQSAMRTTRAAGRPLAAKIEAYAAVLEKALLTTATATPGQRLRQRWLDDALDGAVSRLVKESTSLGRRRSLGAFFSGEGLARKVIRAARPRGRAKFFDPTCGPGDLLLEASHRMPAWPSLRKTLAHWGKRLGGMDIQPEFIRFARIRLALEALRRGGNQDVPRIDELPRLLPQLVVGDVLQELGRVKRFTHLISNPPFSRTKAPSECTWARGKITAAALFFERCLASADPGTSISAVLPDVLRSGSRYEKWRAEIGRRSSLIEVSIHGQFDAEVDIDVFLGVAVRNDDGAAGKAFPSPDRIRGGRRLDHLFEVHVGSVVPHRDPKVGPQRAFLQSKGLTKWDAVRRVRLKRRYAGPTFAPPFVVVRRTSRPGDRSRAQATIVLGKRPVAVENHLIVLSPRDGKRSTCSNLLPLLQSSATNSWLDERIRCRHLTVQAMRGVPIRGAYFD